MLKEVAYNICREGHRQNKPWGWITKQLVEAGVKPARAKRMARRARQGVFMWEGIKVPIAPLRAGCQLSHQNNLLKEGR